MARRPSCFLLLLFGLTQLQRVLSEGHIEIRFRYYESGCGDCDPMFTFCVDRPSDQKSVSRQDCSYGVAGETDHYHNSGRIDFGDNIKGLANPWKVRFGRLHEKQVMLVVRTRDDDLFGADHMATWGMTLTETVYPTESESKYETRRMRSGSHLMVFDIKIYCIEDTYGWDCSRKCVPTDNADGHYDCDKSNGNKICHTGWTGSNCNEDKDECALGFCAHGDCKNLKGDYYCHCHENYSGRNCTILGDPCEYLPCENNGTCVAFENQFNYTCNCSDPWTGQDCEIRRSPCESQPCLNEAECISNEDNTNFTCGCKPLYEGMFCETKLDPTTTAQPTADSGAALNPKDPARITGKDSSAGFLFWHGLLIGLCFLAIIITIVIFFIFRRRRKEKEHCVSGLPPGDAVHFTTEGNLAFENSMYNTSRSKSNSNGHAHETRKHPPLPTTPTDDDNFNPLKHMNSFDVDETQGATGGYDPEEGGYMKPSAVEKELKGQHAEMSESQRAQNNPYSDFRDVRGVQNEPVEPHYQDLDEVAIEFQGLGQQSAPKPQENQYSEPTVSASALPGNWNLGVPRKSGSEYSDIPCNAPAIGVSTSPPLTIGENAYSPIDDEAEFDFALAQRVSARRQDTNDSHYAEPAIPASPLSKSPAPGNNEFGFKNEPYAEVTVPAHRTPSHSLEDDYLHDDEDDIPSFGLPHVDTGYANPPTSPKKNSVEPLYADPKEPESENSNRSNEYALPRSAADPPAIPPKPRGLDDGRPRRSEYEECDVTIPAIPALPLSSAQSSAEHDKHHNVPVDNTSLYSSVPESQAILFTDNSDKSSVPGPAQAPFLFLENPSFVGESEN